MGARTRQQALCLEAAERDIRAMAMGAVLDGIHRAAMTTPGVQFLQRNAAAIDRIRAERLAKEAGE